VCLRSLLMGIVENLIGIWRAMPRFSTSLSRCHTAKLTLKRSKKGYGLYLSVSGRCFSNLHLRPHPSLITNNSTRASCGAMRSIPQTVTGAIMQQWAQLQLASLWSVTQLCLDLATPIVTVSRLDIATPRSTPVEHVLRSIARTYLLYYDHSTLLLR
jgi:hypothetical protein